MESLPSEISHYISAGGVVTIIAYGLWYHKIWVRMKDRVNDLWADYCEKKRIPFRPLENGKPEVHL